MAAVTSVASQQLLQQKKEGNTARVTLRGKYAKNMTKRGGGGGGGGGGGYNYSLLFCHLSVIFIFY